MSILVDVPPVNPPADPVPSPAAPVDQPIPTVEKTTFTAQQAFMALACVGAAIVSFAYLNPLSALVVTVIGAGASYMLNGGDGVVLPKDDGVTQGDLLRHLIPTGLALFFPQTLPWTAGATLLSFGNLAYRTVKVNFS